MTVPDEIASSFSSKEISDSGPEALVLDEEVLNRFYRNHDGKMVGKTFFSPTFDAKVYYSIRNENKHRYHEGDAYPLDDSILQELQKRNVEKVLIGLQTARDVLEFELSQYVNYEDGEKINHGWGDQRYTPEDNAVRIWPNAVGNLQ